MCVGVLDIIRYVYPSILHRINLPHALRSRYEAMCRSPESTVLIMDFSEKITVFDPCLAELKKTIREDR